MSNRVFQAPRRELYCRCRNRYYFDLNVRQPIDTWRRDGEGNLVEYRTFAHRCICGNLILIQKEKEGWWM